MGLGLIVILQACVKVPNTNVKLEVPGMVGYPRIVLLSKNKPGGSIPVMLNVCWPTPPEYDVACRYWTPTVPGAMGHAVRMTGCGTVTNKLQPSVAMFPA